MQTYSERFQSISSLPLWATVTIGLLILVGIVLVSKVSAKWALKNTMSWKPKSKISFVLFQVLTAFMWVVAVICIFSLYVRIAVGPIREW